MNQRQTFVFYCTLMLPAGFILGAEIGSAVGRVAPLAIIGAACGGVCSYLAVRNAAPDETP
jgi:hypothetical protein